MKKKDNLNKINDLIMNYVRAMGKENEFLQARIINHWQDIVGQVIAKYTEKIYFIDKKLFIKTSNPTVKQEFIILKDMIIKKVNSFAKKKLITEIIFL